MAPFYKIVCDTLGWKVDTALMQKLQEQNQKSIQSHDEKAEEVLKNAGETEYSDTLIAKAHYLAKIGEKEVAVQAFELAIEKTAPVGVRIDLYFAVIRIGFFHQDPQMIHQYIEKVKE
jgi:26S proteasome regulatory subunit N7